MNTPREPSGMLENVERALSVLPRCRFDDLQQGTGLHGAMVSSCYVFIECEDKRREIEGLFGESFLSDVDRGKLLTEAVWFHVPPEHEGHVVSTENLKARFLEH